jgi:hypothetical protein
MSSTATSPTASSPGTAPVMTSPTPPGGAPVMTPSALMSIQDARALVGQQLGFAGFDGSVQSYAMLSQADQVKLTDAMSKYIHDNPARFTTAQVGLATKVVNAPAYNTPLADVSLGAQLSQFGSEFEKQVMLKTDLFGGVMKHAIYIGAAVGVIYLLMKYSPKSGR